MTIDNRSLHDDSPPILSHARLAGWPLAPAYGKRLSALVSIHRNRLVVSLHLTDEGST
jgi:hypothetical protein